MNWKRLNQVKNVPPSQASLALGVIGLGQAWALYIPGLGEVIRPYLASLGALLLLPVLLRYLTSFHPFINDILHPLRLTFMDHMSLALFIHMN